MLLCFRTLNIGMRPSSAPALAVGLGRVRGGGSVPQNVESGAGSTATLSADRRVTSPGRGVSRWLELVYSSHIFQSNKSPFNFPPDSGEGKRGSKESPGVSRSRRASLP